MKKEKKNIHRNQNDIAVVRQTSTHSRESRGRVERVACKVCSEFLSAATAPTDTHIHTKCWTGQKRTEMNCEAKLRRTSSSSCRE